MSDEHKIAAANAGQALASRCVVPEERYRSLARYSAGTCQAIPLCSCNEILASELAEEEREITASLILFRQCFRVWYHT